MVAQWFKKTKQNKTHLQCWSSRKFGLIPGSGRSSGRGHGNPLQYSCLENPMDRGAWQATVHRVAKSQIRLSDLACLHEYLLINTVTMTFLF